MQKELLLVLGERSESTKLTTSISRLGIAHDLARWATDADLVLEASPRYAFIALDGAVLPEALPKLLKAQCPAALLALLNAADEAVLPPAFALSADETLGAAELERLRDILPRARRNALQRVRFTELRRAYREQEERFNDVLELSSDWLWEQDERFVFSFAAVLGKSGLDAERIIGKTRWEVARADPAAAPWAEHRMTLERHEPFRNFIYSNTLADGQTAWFSINGKPLFHPDGRFKGYRGTGREITEDYLRAARLRESEERFAHAVRGSSAGIWDWKLPEDTYYMSARFKEILGFRDEEMPNERKSFLSRLHPEDVPILERAVKAHFQWRTPYEVQYRMVRKDGSLVWCHAIGQAVWDDAGRPVRFAGSTSDITAQKEAEERARSLLQQQDAIFENAPVGIAFLRHGRIIRCNQGLSDKLGICREALQGTASPIPVRPRTMGNISTLVRSVSESREVLAGELNVSGPKGEDAWVQYKSTPLDRQDPDQGHVLVTLDITERKRAEQKLLHLAQHDALTDLPNRILYRNILVQALSQARRREWLVAVLFIDLDRFKHVNDSLGHSAGDRLLSTVADRIRRCLRQSDTVARLSGDEFGVIAPDLQSCDDAVAVAKKILASLNDPVHLGPREVSISVSIGIAVFPRDGADPDTLIANADAAMYQAKAMGRSQYQFFTPELNIKAARFLELETKLRQAIARQELELHYQPKACVKTGVITGVEALLRWRVAPREYLAPSEFIPVLEETGLIIEVGEWVLQEACSQLQRWAVQGVHGISVAVNVSARQLRQPEFASQVMKIVEAASVEPASLELEITESAVMQDLEQSLDQLSRLRSAGIGVALDDFGTGYSSLSYLKRLEVQSLKLDRSFMSGVGVAAHDAALASAIIAMARQLDIRVVAEGVETQAQLEFLRARQCDEYQGYLLARPLPSKDMQALLSPDNRARSAPR